MNKRIQELAKEHLLHGKYNGDGDVIEGDYYEFDPEELQKFTELIIQKCITLISPDIRDFDQAFGIKQHCITQIKEHFKISK
jgi:hypothetical protein